MSEGGHYEKAVYWMSPTIWHSGKRGNSGDTEWRAVPGAREAQAEGSGLLGKHDT